MAYGTVAEVEALVGDLVESRVFGASTIPTLAQVTAFLVSVAAELDVELKSAGYVVPVDIAVDPEAYAFLKTVNAYGACLLALASLPAEAELTEGQEGLRTRAQTFNVLYQRALKRIKERTFPATSANLKMTQMFAGSQEDEDGNVKLPIFSRGHFDYPGSRSLIE